MAGAHGKCHERGDTRFLQARGSPGRRERFRSDDGELSRKLSALYGQLPQHRHIGARGISQVIVTIGAGKCRVRVSVLKSDKQQ